jgi:hypothetical protein
MSIQQGRLRPLFVLVVVLFVVTTTWNRNNGSIVSTGTTVVKEIIAQEDDSCHKRWNTTNTNHTSICLVHLGKTAGSTITCMMNRSVQQSGKGNSGCAATELPLATAISRYVSQRVHLDSAPLHFDSFLITLRNPIERIKSWYYYLHPDFPPEKLPRHKQGCADFAFFQCWPTLQSFVSVGLNHSFNTTHSAAEDECTAWAWGIATGSRHCWHNYWNYNRTYGPLLGTQKEIFAIRTEHTWDDWIKIDSMLGGTGKLEKLPNSKNNFGEKPKNLTLDEGGRDNLCRALCNEIQIYKQLLQMAKNLCREDKQQSLAELLETCPKETEGVTTCTY